MEKTDTPIASVQSLMESAESYAGTSIELAKLKSLDAAGKIASSFIAQGSVIVMITFFALFFNVGLALLIGENMGHIYYGFFIVAGFYLLVGMIFHFYLRSWISRPISNLIIKEALQ